MEEAGDTYGACGFGGGKRVVVVERNPVFAAQAFQPVAAAIGVARRAGVHGADILRLGLPVDGVVAQAPGQRLEIVAGAVRHKHTVRQQRRDRRPILRKRRRVRHHLRRDADQRDHIGLKPCFRVDQRIKPLRHNAADKLRHADGADAVVVAVGHFHIDTNKTIHWLLRFQ